MRRPEGRREPWGRAFRKVDTAKMPLLPSGSALPSSFQLCLYKLSAASPSAASPYPRAFPGRACAHRQIQGLWGLRLIEFEEPSLRNNALEGAYANKVPWGLTSFSFPDKCATACA